MSSFRHPRATARVIAALMSGLAVLACLPATSDLTAASAPRGNGLAPAGAPAGTCWGKVEPPAIVETVTEQVLVSPALTNPDGTIAQLPVYRRETRRQIVAPRKEVWFETPCPPSFTVEFVSSLQRALIARGLYAGPVTGSMDASTRASVLSVQREDGLDSDVLSIATARKLGLVNAVPVG